MNYKHSCIAGFMSLLLVCAGCGKSESDRAPQGFNWNGHTPFTTSYNVFGMPFTTAYESLPAEQGTVEMTEASGIGKSVKNPGMIWAHNDSGHPNTLFLVDAETGRIVASYQVAGTANHDWEDLEVRIDPGDGKSYLYVGDVGDNDQKRPDYSVYRFEEPQFLPAHDGQLVRVTDIPVERFRFRYPDGKHNVESLFVDPLTKDIFLVTKSGVTSVLYVLPFPQSAQQMNTAIKAGSFSFREASAGSVSPDGSRIMIRNRQDLFYWEKTAEETMVQTLQRTPVKAPYIGEVQGEAVCFDEANNYYTLSEKANMTTFPILYKYHKKQ